MNDEKPLYLANLFGRLAIIVILIALTYFAFLMREVRQHNQTILKEQRK